MSIFRDLLKIKSFREGQAEVSMRAQQTAFQRAAEAQASARQLLIRLVEEHRRQEQCLYQDLCARIVKMRDIDNLHQALAEFRHQEQRQQEAVNQALMAQNIAAEKLDAARALHREASKQKSKFMDLAINHAQELQRAADYREDMELEETASISRDRDDWGMGAPEESA